MEVPRDMTVAADSGEELTEPTKLQDMEVPARFDEGLAKAAR